ncbi:MAG: dTDP-4-dehydrorhamnose reductase [Flammeovirgaceae bacterium]
MSKKVLVTGANGQLGKELQHLSAEFPFQFVFTDTNELDITKASGLRTFFKKNKFDFCINAAAYTAVDHAESDAELCNTVNMEGAANLAEACDAYDVKLLHISTDFVFDGERHTPYDEQAYANPLNIYGRSKFEGERVILDTLSDAIIIRTSWLYSSFGSNFVKTMLRLASQHQALTVVEDQIGTPTYARDLAHIILKILTVKWVEGIYHFSNEGVASWYDFAHAIFDIKGITIDLAPIKSKEYKTAAQRPLYSVLDKSKIKKIYDIKIRHWRDALNEMLAN